MSIDIEEFDAASEEELAGRTNAERVLAFLAANSERAFRQTEIADGADVKRGSIGPVLSRLEDRGLVRHKGPYWAIGEAERLRDAAQHSSSIRFLDEKVGQEDAGEWRPE